jgi:UDP-N-acetylmuramoyl-tripeptide--D-alanyl-D-alanine ligase
MEFSLARISQATGAKARNCDEQMVTGYSIDSRTVAPGDLFFALRGERVDGHAYVSDVLARGAAAAVVSEGSYSGAVLEVADTLKFLQTFAHWARQQWGRPVVAVTGSAGKTSTKDIIAALLGVRLVTGKTVGNFNNHIGLPLSLLRIPDSAEVAVLELGMNHAGEIRDLSAIAEPQVAVVTNVGYAHVENFASIEGVAAAKRELVEALAADGTAVLNADDERVAAFAGAHRGRSLTYGVSEEADVRATDVEITADGANFMVSGVAFRSRLSGLHGVRNILAGIAVAGLFGIAPRDLVGVVQGLAPGKMRGERMEWNGITILNDAYNSNPEAARHMLDVLRGLPGTRHIAVLGEMLELGHMSAPLHRELGDYAAGVGVDLLIGIHGDAAVMVEQAPGALFFETPEEAGDFLRTFVRTGDVVLFKGSRGTRVELALERMQAQNGSIS